MRSSCTCVRFVCIHSHTLSLDKAFHVPPHTVFRDLPMLLRLKAASIPSGMPFHASAMSLGKPASIFFFSSLYLKTQRHNTIWGRSGIPLYIPEPRSIITIALQVGIVLIDNDSSALHESHV